MFYVSIFLNFIKYILETKTSLEWSKYSFKIDFHILKGLKTSLEVKSWKMTKTVRSDQPNLTSGWPNLTSGRPKMAEYCLLEPFELSESTVMTSSIQPTKSTIWSTEFDRLCV